MQNAASNKNYKLKKAKKKIAQKKESAPDH